MLSLCQIGFCLAEKTRVINQIVLKKVAEIGESEFKCYPHDWLSAEIFNSKDPHHPSVSSTVNFFCSTQVLVAILGDATTHWLKRVRLKQLLTSKQHPGIPNPYLTNQQHR